MQKRIRRILQNMTFANSINAAVWEEGYRRWFYLIDTLTRSSEDTGDPNVLRSLDRKSSPEVRPKSLREMKACEGNKFTVCRNASLSGRT